MVVIHNEHSCNLRHESEQLCEVAFLHYYNSTFLANVILMLLTYNVVIKNKLMRCKSQS